jgi:hypothetical protein
VVRHYQRHGKPPAAFPLLGTGGDDKLTAGRKVNAAVPMVIVKETNRTS